jgi:hypothetical protein
LHMEDCAFNMPEGANIVGKSEIAKRSANFAVFRMANIEQIIKAHLKRRESVEESRRAPARN